MAYFSALGGTGGTSATITVTYSEDFYGVTITATNGTTTLTKTATSSGTLVFDVSEGGTWVVSGTVEGATYSEQVDVLFEYTVPPLVALPDGSTALPVNDIQMWLKCAAIRDKTTYTTLSDVLGDTETLIALCADSNACDYMARSTNWASGVAADSTAMLIVGKYNYCANALLSDSTWASAIGNSAYASSVISALVPTMTSNTTPEGTCFGSTNDGATYDYYRAFDDSAKGWSPSSSDSFGTANCGYESPVPIIVTKWAIKEITSAFNRVYRLEGSNDGTTYTPIKTSDAITTADSWVYFTFNNSTAYKYHRVVVVSGSQYVNTGQGRKFQFYGRTDNANYIPLVPKMTSNTTPSGECSASVIYGAGYEAYRAFDGDSATRCAPYNTSNVSVDHYVAYEFENPCIVDKAVVTIGGTNTPSRTYKFQGYNGTSWVDVSESFTNASGTFEHIIDTQGIAYQGYRIFYPNCILWVQGSYSVDITELQFYRKSDLPIIHSAVEDNIFYMDDGSPVALCGIPVGDTIDVDMESFKGQTLTLVSTVAKDPDNLSNDFSMNVRITPNITEIYLMPYGELYWYGHIANIVEECSTANGWSNSGGFTNPTYSKNKVRVVLGSSPYPIGGLGTKVPITFDKMHFIGQGISANSDVYGNCRDNSSKATASAHNLISFTNNTLQKDSVTYTANDRYVYIYGEWSYDMNAWWLE